MSVAPEPNYPPRTQRSYHKARSRSSVHHAHYAGPRNSQRTCRSLGRGVDEAPANPPLIWRQVQTHPPFGFQNRSLEGHFANRVSYLLYWSLAAFRLLAKSHSPLEQMGVLLSVDCGERRFANIYTVAVNSMVPVVVAWGAQVFLFTDLRHAAE